MTPVDITGIAFATAIVLLLLWWGINTILRKEDPGTRAFRPRHERALDPGDAQTVEFWDHLADRCSDPPEVSCSDAGCPVHGDEYHPLDDWADETVTLNVPQPGNLDESPGKRSVPGLGHLIARLITGKREGRALHGLNHAHTDVPRPSSSGGRTAKTPGLATMPGSHGPGHSLVLRRNRPVPFHTAGRLQEACATAALIAYAESILAGVSA